MLNLLKQRWWKLVAVLFLGYALIAGLSIPLSSGVTDVTPTEIETGTPVQVDLLTYNTHFADLERTPDVVIKKGDILVCATAVEMTSDRSLVATFNIANDIPLKRKKALFDLIVHDEQDGTFYLANGISVVKHGDVEDMSYQSCVLPFGISEAQYTTFPYREILYESIRNLYFHVPMWFTMAMLLLFSFVSSILFLGGNKPLYDVYASQAALVGLLFGTLGILTGMTWANFTWGEPWPNDPKLNGAAVGMLIYLAYFVLRGSLTDQLVRGKVAAVYNIFAFVLYIVFIFVLPRLTDSLHPGNGGNPAFGQYDLDNTMRPVFYSAAFGFIVLGHWIMSLRIRYVLLHQRSLD